MPSHEDTLTLLFEKLQPKLVDAASRREVVSELLRALKTCWQTVNDGSDREVAIVTRGIFSTIASEIGWGDVQLREFCLRGIDSIRYPAILQGVLDILPLLMNDDETVSNDGSNEICIQKLHKLVLLDSKALIPVLKCMASLPYSESCDTLLLQLTRSSLNDVDKEGLPTVLKILLSRVGFEKEASSVWEALRERIPSVEDTVGLDFAENDYVVCQVIINSFDSAINGDLLARSYLSELKRMEPCEVELYLMDAAALLALSSTACICDDVDRIMDEWLQKGCFPFVFFTERVLPFLCTAPLCDEAAKAVLRSELAPGLLRLAVFLLLAPTRIESASQSILASTERFVLQLYAAFDPGCRAKLAHSLLLMSDQTSEAHHRQMPRVQSKDAPSPVQSHQLVNTVLVGMVERAPDTFDQLKYLFSHRLLSVSLSQSQVLTFCLILSRMQDGPALMSLLQKLLFSPGEGSGQTAGEKSRIVKGLSLANSMVQFCDSLPKQDFECVVQWVSRVLLPTTRRSVSPEIGLPGLRFLTSVRCMDESHAVETFQCFKMVLANTGLIQVLQQYQSKQKGDDAVVIAYTQVPDAFATGAIPTPQARQFLFCVRFFIMQGDALLPSSWEPTVRWVSELVDTYLRMGRNKARNGWNPSSWLQAAIELHDVGEMTSLQKRKKSSPLDWITRQLACNELSPTGPMKVTLRVEKDLRGFMTNHCSVVELRRLAAVCLSFSLSVLAGIALSFAVLRNAFEHYNTFNATKATKTHEFRRLIQFQLAKIYDLSSKATLTEWMLASIAFSMRRRTQLNGKAPFAMPDSGEDVCTQHEHHNEQLLSAVEEALKHSRSLHSTFFKDGGFVSAEILWCSLIGMETDRLIEEAIDSSSTSDLCNRIYTQDLLRLQVDVLDHIHSLMQPSNNVVTISTTNLVFCMKMSILLVKSLSPLRQHLHSRGDLVGL